MKNFKGHFLFKLIPKFLYFILIILPFSNAILHSKLRTSPFSLFSPYLRKQNSPNNIELIPTTIDQLKQDLGRSTLLENQAKELFINARVDNFDMSKSNGENEGEFNLRFLVSDKYYVKGSPIFFYCGNESPIEDFFEATGFLHTTLAQTFKALVVYGEHRFFGKSWPFQPPKQDLDINI